MMTLLDRLLKVCEKQADDIGYRIDLDPDYIKICQITTDFQFGEPINWTDKYWTWATLRYKIMPQLGLDWSAIYAHEHAKTEWERMLEEVYHCYADENGNRPCDNGALCDRCRK